MQGSRWVPVVGAVVAVLVGCSSNGSSGTGGPMPDVTPIDARPIDRPPAEEGGLPAPRPTPGGATGGATGGAQERPFEGTTAPSERLRPGMKPATLKEVRAAENEGFDRVVMEFAGAGVPGWRARYLEGSARQCGSGEPVKVAGAALLEVTLLPAQAHDEKGQVTWVLGLSEKVPYRVLELSSPARVVVDVRR